jgi:hypothetical protein
VYRIARLSWHGYFERDADLGLDLYFGLCDQA